MYYFLNEISFHGIMLDYIFDQSYEFRKVRPYTYMLALLLKCVVFSLPFRKIDQFLENKF